MSTGPITGCGKHSPPDPSPEDRSTARSRPAERRTRPGPEANSRLPAAERRWLPDQARQRPTLNRGATESLPVEKPQPPAATRGSPTQPPTSQHATDGRGEKHGQREVLQFPDWRRLLQERSPQHSLRSLREILRVPCPGSRRDPQPMNPLTTALQMSPPASLPRGCDHGSVLEHSMRGLQRWARRAQHPRASLAVATNLRGGPLPKISSLPRGRAFWQV